MLCDVLVLHCGLYTHYTYVHSLYITLISSSARL